MMHPRSLLLLILPLAAPLFLGGCVEEVAYERNYDSGGYYGGGGPTEVDFVYESGRPYSRQYGPLVYRSGAYYYTRGGSYYVYNRSHNSHHDDHRDYDRSRSNDYRHDDHDRYADRSHSTDYRREADRHHEEDRRRVEAQRQTVYAQQSVRSSSTHHSGYDPGRQASSSTSRVTSVNGHRTMGSPPPGVRAPVSSSRPGTVAPQQPSKKKKKDDDDHDHH